MLIKEVDFKNIIQYKNTKVIPVFMLYCEECYEIAISEKQSKNAWSIFQKIFYSKFYEHNKEYLEPLLDVRLFSNEKSREYYIFSKTDKTFHNQFATTKDTATKFAKNAYIGVELENYDNLVILGKMVKDTDLKDFRLFVSTVEDISNENFKKEYSTVRELFTKKKKSPYKIKKGNLVVGHINGLILNEEEKLIKYIRREFDKKSLLGDITLDESQEIILNNYMRFQLNKFVNSTIKDKKLDFKPDYSRVFAFGLVRYAMKYYNKRHSGDFWPHFKEEFEVEIGVNKQQFLHDEFKRIMNLYNKNYDDNIANKIDNMTMHSFVADNSAFQLFDCLFDFWRLDLGRNSDNLFSEEGSIAFKTLIDAMEHGTQDIMSHTSSLLKFDKTKMVCKNRVKRILKLINQAFWNECTINETGNRINHLLNMWIAEPKGAFQKEKNYVKKHILKEKGNVMFHSPIFSISYDTETLKLILPHQRLIECNEEDNPIWKISCSDSDFNIELKPEYKHDKIGYYVEGKYVEIPMHLMLSEFSFTLVSGEKELKKYKIHKSNIRFFDGKGKYIDYKTANIPVGFVTSYSKNEAYPYVLGEDSNALYADGLIMKNFELTKGQIIVLDDETGLQAGQKLEEGLNETYPIAGAFIENNDIEHQIYAKLPKLIFKSNSDQISGVSLVINGTHYKIIDKIKEFKLADDLKANGYLIDLNDYIYNEGLYSIKLSYPKMYVQKSLYSIAYIKDFDYQFKGAPYIFKEFGTIMFKKGLRINKTQSEKEGEWESNFSFDEFTFNFGERKKGRDNYCELVCDRRLKLQYTLNGTNYPIYFDIPALYWKFNQTDDWNTKSIANVMLKDLKNKFKKLYISGPFSFIKSIITTTDDVEIAEEESEIKFQSGKNQYFDISKIYDWFKNDRSEVLRKVYISLDEKEYSLFDVVCKSRLDGLSLIGDFDGGVLKGEVNIEGNESYTVTIYHNEKLICEDEQIIDNKFSIETELATGNYEVYVYEISENDDEDGFDVESESILLNKNSKPIIKRLINLKDLSRQRILLKGYQDINKKYIPRYFNSSYYMVNLEKTTYFDFLDEQKGSEIYGVWDVNIDTSDEEIMCKFTYYKAELLTRKYDGSYKSLMNVLILFKDTMNLESIVILAKDSDGDDFGSLCVEKEKMWIITGEQYKGMPEYERKKCGHLFDDQDFYLIDIEEEKKYEF